MARMHRELLFRPASSKLVEISTDGRRAIVGDLLQQADLSPTTEGLEITVVESDTRRDFFVAAGAWNFAEAAGIVGEG